ncbi:SCO6880 family protein, partial [Cellulomonas sp. 73-92]|uniref:SCO6880 family protein n=1 Tax=Cellulomonas sp. 73-92 TaxID=1895740 RepID=UPI000A4B5849
MTASQSGSTTVFGRLERRGVLLGLSAAQLAVVGVAVAVAVTAVYSAGSGGLLVSAPLWVVLLVVGTVTVGGRPLVGWLPLMTAWRGRQLRGATSVARSTRVEHQPRTLTLPGVAGRLELVEEPSLGGVLVVDRRAGTATALLAVNASGFLLDDGSVQEHKVGAWGRVLAGICQQSTIVRVQFLVRTVPGGLTPARRGGFQSWSQHVLENRGSCWRRLVVLRRVL